MTRAVRRTTTFVLAVVAAMTLSLALVAGPALATEGEEGATEETHAEDSTGFGAGRWDGMVLTAITGLLVGVMIFAMSSPGQIHRADAHH